MKYLFIFVLTLTTTFQLFSQEPDNSETTPTAKANNLELNFYDPRDMKIKEFMANTKGKNVLVVGHSNTTPMFTNGLLGEKKYEMIADDNNANLYIVTVTEDSISAMVLVVD